MVDPDNRCLVCGAEVVDDKCAPGCVMMEDAPDIGGDLNADIVLDAEESRVVADLIDHPPEPTLAMCELFRRYGREE